ncbi:MAG: metallophosphoesterase family protein [Planctomycetota bacterium]|jgi:predicted phosphodiesterase
MAARFLRLLTRIVGTLAVLGMASFIAARVMLAPPEHDSNLLDRGARLLASAPAPDEPVILVIGDSGAGTPEFRANIDAMAKEQAWCALHTGDVSYSGPTEFGRFLRQAERLPFPLLAVAGDHDTDWDPDLRDFEEHIAPGGDHYFDAGDVRFVFLDTSTEDIASASLDFLEIALGDPDRPKRSVVVTHTPPFQPNLRYPRSIGKGHAIHSADKVRRMIDILAREKVNVLTCGHWHAFENTDVAGFPLVISGGGGKHVEEGHAFHYARITLSDPIRVEMVETTPREGREPLRWAFDKSLGTWLRIGGSVSALLVLLWSLCFAASRVTAAKMIPESGVTDDA